MEGPTVQGGGGGGVTTAAPTPSVCPSHDGRRQTLTSGFRRILKSRRKGTYQFDRVMIGRLNMIYGRIICKCENHRFHQPSKQPTKSTKQTSQRRMSRSEKMPDRSIIHPFPQPQESKQASKSKRTFPLTHSRST